MNVLFTFKIKDEQMDKLKADFPGIRFTFNKKIDADPIDDFEIIVTYGEDITNEVLS